MTGTIEVSARTDIGTVREVNEDSLLARSPVFIVADGLGGHARGDAASQAVVRVFDERIPADRIPTPDQVLETVRAANETVRQLSDADEVGIAVAGTTLSGIVQVREIGSTERRWMIINVGDSRVYSWDGRTLTQLSVDHSAVQELVDAGALTPEQAEAHPDRNVITRALGAEDTVDVDVWLRPVVGAQTFLICSDGLTKEIGDAQIATILAATPAAVEGSGERADRLVEAALEAGGRDNVTVIVVESHMGEPSGDNGPTRDRAETTPEYLEDTHPRDNG